MDFRKSLYLALIGLMLMLCTGAYYERQPEETAASALLAARDGYSLYAGETPPAGEMRQFDRDTLYRGLLMYVSPAYPLPGEMPALSVRNVRAFVGLYIPAAQETCLTEETIYALCDLCADDPLLHTWVMDGMRAPREQNALQTAAFAAYQQQFPLSEALKKAVRDVPGGGQSEHQLGTAFDLQLNGALSWEYEDALLRSADGRWLYENAWKYGFIRRYSPDKRDITGVQNEELHLRYVGREHALIMHVTGWCLEEYLQALHRFGSLRLESPNGENVHVLCTQMQENGAAFAIPAGITAAPSADNLGYAVCVFTAAQ